MFHVGSLYLSDDLDHSAQDQSVDVGGGETHDSDVHLYPLHPPSRRLNHYPKLS